jgi:hypothetical protein
MLSEDKDVDIRITGGDGMDAFLSDARSKVQKPAAKKYKAESKRYAAKQLGLDDDYRDPRHFYDDQYYLGGQVWGL